MLDEIFHFGTPEAFRIRFIFELRWLDKQGDKFHQNPADQ